MAKPQKVQNIVMGAGYLYFDEEDENGNLTGERYMGDTPGFTVNVTTEELDIDDSDQAVAEPLLSITKKVSRSGSVTARDADGDNLASFFMAEKGSNVQAAATPVAQPIANVMQGRYYQLGASLANPTGLRNVTDFVFKDGGTTYVEGTDYTFDEPMARVYIVQGGGIAAGTSPEWDGTVAAVSRGTVVTWGERPRKGALHFIADNTEGDNRDVYIPKLGLKPDGDYMFKSRDEIQKMNFKFSIETRDGLQQIYLDGQAS